MAQDTKPRKVWDTLTPKERECFSRNLNKWVREIITPTTTRYTDYQVPPVEYIFISLKDDAN